MEVNNPASYFKNSMKITSGPWAKLLEFQTKSLPAEIILTLLAKESKECFFSGF